MEDSSRQALRARLGRASSRELLQLVVDHRETLGAGEVRRALRNPFVTAEVIDALAENRRLAGSYEVRSAVARHRRTPETTALRFISGLFWRDLLDISVDMRISPAVRRVAEKYLVERLKRVTVGEKIAIARRAAGGTLKHLMKDPNLTVVKALLSNPRLTEPGLLPLVSNEEALPRVLDLVASDPRWAMRYEIRLALCRNPRSPYRVIFELLPSLLRRDLLEIAGQEDHTWVVRHRARELLSDSEGGARASDI